MKEYITTQIRILKGCLPEDTSWWTEEDWNRHKEYVEELQTSGEYLKEEVIIVTYKPNPYFDNSRGEADKYIHPVQSSKLVFLNFKDDTLR